jgi:phosphoribosylanthranilate isomerase
MISPGSVKICSLREPEHARIACDAGADLFGLIFVPGARRLVTVETAREIVLTARAHRSEQSPLAAGVFVDQPADEVNRIADEVGLDLVQLSGSEPPEYLAQIERPVTKAFHPEAGAAESDIRRMLDAYAAAANAPLAFLIDGFHPTLKGGTGIRADWSLAAALARSYPLMLAGGLTPENIAEAVTSVNPLTVDVGSGVETDGVKDAGKIRDFVANAKAAYARALEQMSNS